MFAQFIDYCFANYSNYALGAFFVSLASIAYVYALLPNSLTLTWKNSSTAYKAFNVICWAIGVLVPVLNVISFFSYIAITLVYGLVSYSKFGKILMQADREAIA